MEFSDCIGQFYFHEGNVRLDLWDEFLLNDDENRLWLVESGERLLFNDKILQTDTILIETIERFCDWLNDELVQKKWKDKELNVWGKIVFMDDLNHDVVAAVLWRDGKFEIKTHDFP